MANLNIPVTRDRTLDAFKGKMIGGGARSNLFECELYFPDDAVPSDSSRDDISDQARFLVKAASLPESTISNINIPYRGRELKVAGDRTFAPWSITVINDVDFKIRTSFERWMNLINKHEDNSGITDPSAYQQDLFIRQLGRSQVAGPVPVSAVQIPILKQYRFYGAFPTTVSSIDLSYENTDAIEEFTVELQYQWYDAIGPDGGTQLGTGS